MPVSSNNRSTRTASSFVVTAFLCHAFEPCPNPLLNLIRKSDGFSAGKKNPQDSQFDTCEPTHLNSHELFELTSEVTSTATASTSSDQMTESQQHPSTMHRASSREEAVFANYKQKTSEMLSEAYQALFLMSAASAMLLLVRIAVASPWAALLPLYSAGFVLWPLLSAFRAEAMWLAAPIIADMVMLAAMPRITPSKRRQLNEVFIVALTAVALVILAGAVYCTYWPVTSSDNMRELSLQHEAVARFNRGFCKAWCRHKDTSMAAFARGQCPLDEATVFDYLVSHVDMKDWCTEALKTQDYSLGSKYNGFSPFASWMGGGVDDGAQVSTPRWLIILHTLLCLGFHSEVFVNVDNITSEDGDKSD